MKQHKEGNDTDISSGALLLTGSKIITLAISLVTSMLLSRYRSLEEYGTYSELMLVITLAVAIFTLGVPNSLNFFLPKTKTQSERDLFLSVYYFNTTVLAAICGLILVILLPLIVFYFGNESITSYAYVLAILPWTRIILGGRSHMLVAMNLVKREIFYNILNSVCLLLIIVMTIYFQQNLRFYVLLYVIEETIFCLAVYYETSRIIQRVGPVFDKRLIKQILLFSIPLGISTAIGTLCTEIDKFMIGTLYPPDQVALYTNAGKELPFSYLSVSFVAIVLPRIAQLNRDNRYNDSINLWKKTSEFCFYIMSFCSIACIVFAPQIVSVLYSEKYLPATGVFRIYSIAIMFRITNFGLLLNANGRTKLVLVSSIVTLISNIVLNLTLYLFLGFYGPALATIISLIISIIIQLWLTTREYHLVFSNIMNWGKLVRILIINLISGCIVYLLLNSLHLDLNIKGILIAACIGIVWAVFYFGSVFKTLVNKLHEINAFN